MLCYIIYYYVGGGEERPGGGGHAGAEATGRLSPLRLSPLSLSLSLSLSMCIYIQHRWLSGQIHSLASGWT